MVERRAVDKSKRMSADQMEEQLRATHPDRFNIPNVHNKGSVVTTCLKERGREAALEAAAATVPKSGEAGPATTQKSDIKCQQFMPKRWNDLCGRHPQ